MSEGQPITRMEPSLPSDWVQEGLSGDEPALGGEQALVVNYHGALHRYAQNRGLDFEEFYARVGQRLLDEGNIVEVYNQETNRQDGFAISHLQFANTEYLRLQIGQLRQWARVSSNPDISAYRLPDHFYQFWRRSSLNRNRAVETDPFGVLNEVIGRYYSSWPTSEPLNASQASTLRGELREALVDSIRIQIARLGEWMSQTPNPDISAYRLPDHFYQFWRRSSLNRNRAVETDPFGVLNEVIGRYYSSWPTSEPLNASQANVLIRELKQLREEVGIPD